MAGVELRQASATLSGTHRSYSVWPLVLVWWWSFRAYGAGLGAERLECRTAGVQGTKTGVT